MIDLRVRGGTPCNPRLKISDLKTSVSVDLVLGTQKQAILIEPGARPPAWRVDIPKDFIRHSHAPGTVDRNSAGSAQHEPRPMGNAFGLLDMALLEPQALSERKAREGLGELQLLPQPELAPDRRKVGRVPYSKKKLEPLDPGHIPNYGWTNEPTVTAKQNGLELRSIIEPKLLFQKITPAIRELALQKKPIPHGVTYHCRIGLGGKSQDQTQNR
jgi:hypothetical protein